MSRIGQWIVRLSLHWLDRFRLRHGLDVSPPYASSPAASEPEIAEVGSLLLHVGCGHASMDNIFLPGFRKTSWREVRLDADPNVSPDIVGTMADMSSVPDGFADAIFSSHGIEHLYWHDVPKALAEFFRTLKDDGFVVITCPDIQAAAQMIAEDRMFETAYLSAAGPITPFDIVYSYRPFVEANPEWMSHHCGFTLSTLMGAVRNAGFSEIRGCRRPGGFDLWVLACKSKRSAEEISVLVKDYLPEAG